MKETPLLKGRSSNGIPLYLQLERILKDKISSGELKPGDQIPPETELCRQYRVSRITVRNAVDVLVRENLLVAQQGKGTFVAPPKLKRQLPRLYSFSDDMVKLGLTPSSSVITFTLESAESEDRDTLRLPPHDPYVFHLVRVRRANGIPILLERTQIPRFLCPDFLNTDLEKGSLYHTLREKYGLELHDAEETYEAEIAQPDDAAVLDYEPGRPVFAIHRIAYLRDGTPFELTRAIGRGDHLQFTLHLQSNQTEFRPAILTRMSQCAVEDAGRLERWNGSLG
ncbi:MAG: GntR family transcriptional regulator [Spirochaetaceae bacterium]|nr:MAG: GntR family transcriptional regulator [Spirochaetaceae bacterium]